MDNFIKGYWELVGEGFGPLIQIYLYSVQADLIRMKPESMHYVCFDEAQADTPQLHGNPPKMFFNITYWRNFLPKFKTVNSSEIVSS